MSERHTGHLTQCKGALFVEVKVLDCCREQPLVAFDNSKNMDGALCADRLLNEIYCQKCGRHEIGSDMSVITSWNAQIRHGVDEKFLA